MSIKNYWLIVLIVGLSYRGTSQRQSCYTILSSKGDDYAQKGAYREAIEVWNKAKGCSDLPKQHDLDSRIKVATEALKPKPAPTPTTTARPKPTPPAQTPRTNPPPVIYESSTYNTTAPRNSTNAEETAWTVALEKNETTVFKAFLTTYPNSSHAGEARQRLKDLEFQPLFAAKMVTIEGGSFEMGTNNANYYADERPAHTVVLRGYAISKFEVTQAQWRAVMNTLPTELGNDFCADCPITYVSWQDVQQFLEKLNVRSTKKYRLPTEAEWEFAAKGGKLHSSYEFSGDHAADKVAWFSTNASGKIQAIGTKKPNDLGLYDLTGNVQEWCQDAYSETFYKESPTQNPLNKAESPYRVTRGGSYDDSEEDCRITARIRENVVAKSAKIGFRLVSD